MRGSYELEVQLGLGSSNWHENRASYKKRIYNRFLSGGAAGVVTFATFSLTAPRFSLEPGYQQTVFRVKRENVYYLRSFYIRLRDALAQGTDKHQGVQLTIVPIEPRRELVPGHIIALSSVSGFFAVGPHMMHST